MAVDTKDFYAKDRQAWRRWLKIHHQTELSVWLVFDKVPNRLLTYDEMVEEALCFGWIDSRPGKVSDTKSKLYFSKRKPKSAWSKSNKERIIRLRKQGLMAPAGESAIAIGMANGMWDQLNASDNFKIPSDLQSAFDYNPKAKDFYDRISNSSKRIILEWIYSSKTDATRERRVHETVEQALKGIKAHHYEQKNN